MFRPEPQTPGGFDPSKPLRGLSVASIRAVSPEVIYRGPATPRGRGLRCPRTSISGAPGASHPAGTSNQPLRELWDNHPSRGLRSSNHSDPRTAISGGISAAASVRPKHCPSGGLLRIIQGVGATDSGGLYPRVSISGGQAFVTDSMSVAASARAKHMGGGGQPLQGCQSESPSPFCFLVFRSLRGPTTGGFGPNQTFRTSTSIQANRSAGRPRQAPLCFRQEPIQYNVHQPEASTPRVGGFGPMASISGWLRSDGFDPRVSISGVPGANHPARVSNQPLRELSALGRPFDLRGSQPLREGFNRKASIFEPLRVSGPQGTSIRGLRPPGAICQGACPRRLRPDPNTLRAFTSGQPRPRVCFGASIFGGHFGLSKPLRGLHSEPPSPGASVCGWFGHSAGQQPGASIRPPRKGSRPRRVSITWPLKVPVA
jgi:hypothetical protein